MAAVPDRSVPPEYEPGGLDLRPVLRAAWRERARVASIALAASLITLGVAFLLPKSYRATAVILPPEESDLFDNIALGQRALSKFPAFGILSDYFTPADIFKAVLLSRTVQEDVVDRFDLKRIYRQKSMEKTLRILKGNYRVKLNADGTISVSVDDRDPKRAAAMANEFLVGLDRYNVEKRNTQARRTRLFLERRVAETDSALRVSEVALKSYQEAHHTIAPTGESAAGLQAAADLMARKIALEVRLGVLRGYLREDNDVVTQTRDELEQLKGRIGTLPALQDELTRLLRDHKIQEQLYLLLTAELEQSRISETMDTPTVQVLDPAKPPERHSRPHRLILSVVAGLLAVLGSVVWIAAREGTRSPSP